MIKNFFYILACVVYHSLFSQDNYHYRLSTVHASVSNFSMISAVNPQVPGFSPSFFISVKSLRTDSMYRQEKKIHFVAMLGGSYSYFRMKDPVFLSGLYDKSNFDVLSRRMFVGFGVNGRFLFGEKIYIDLDLAPCLEVIKDYSLEVRPDAVVGFKYYDDFYRGIQLFTNAKCEYKFNSHWGCFATAAASVELIKKIGKDFPVYKNPFATQLLLGIGCVYYYTYKRK